MKQKDKTLSANELMVDDIVMFGCLDGTSIIVKLTEIGEFHMHGQSASASHWANIKDVHAVKTTVAFLEKNGFKKSDGTAGIHGVCYELENPEERYVITVVFYGADYGNETRLLLNIDYKDAECLNIKCDYIHQLQHALKLCGIKKEFEI